MKKFVFLLLLSATTALHSMGQSLVSDRMLTSILINCAHDCGLEYAMEVYGYLVRGNFKPVNPAALVQDAQNFPLMLYRNADGSVTEYPIPATYYPISVYDSSK